MHTNHAYDTLSEATEDLKARGFDNEFMVTDDIEITATNFPEERAYAPDEVKVVEFHRFEGPSDPADMTVVYALETQGGEKGILIDGYSGASSDEKVDKFVANLVVEHN